ncbi:hypothetical protein VTO73DRAFT_12721 [Trametes versicolor]
MPAQSVHNEVLEAYITFSAIQLALLPPQSASQLLAQVERDCAAIHAILTTRYLNPRTPVAKQGSIDLVWKYAEQPEHHHRFINMLRVSPHIFDTLVRLIEDHPIFQNHSNNPQAPIQVQLAITLYRMGHYGNGASLQEIARWAGCAEGTVELYMDRCQGAIMSLHNMFVRPLSEAEKEMEKQWIEEQLGFTGTSWREGFVMYDGTIIVFYARPGMDGDAYYTRKCNYGLNAQVSD